MVIVAEDGQELEGHRCVLAARLQYFRSMLGFGAGTSAFSLGTWSESSLKKVTKINEMLDLSDFQE
jgi:hypothetical protein